MAAVFPVGTLEQHHEIVAADVAAEVRQRIDDLGQGSGQHDNDIVAFTVAEYVVERLEAVDIEVAGVKADSVLQQAVDVFVDWDASGQLRQRIGVAGGLHLHFGDHAHQVVGTANSRVAAILGDDESIIDVPAC